MRHKEDEGEDHESEQKKVGKPRNRGPCHAPRALLSFAVVDVASRPTTCPRPRASAVEKEVAKRVVNDPLERGAERHCSRQLGGGEQPLPAASGEVVAGLVDVRALKTERLAAEDERWTRRMTDDTLLVLLLGGEQRSGHDSGDRQPTTVHY